MPTSCRPLDSPSQFPSCLTAIPPARAPAPVLEWATNNRMPRPEGVNRHEFLTVLQAGSLSLLLVHRWLSSWGVPYTVGRKVASSPLFFRGCQSHPGGPASECHPRGLQHMNLGNTSIQPVRSTEVFWSGAAVVGVGSSF